jgi:hypothetical protein
MTVDLNDLSSLEAAPRRFAWLTRGSEGPRFQATVRDPSAIGQVLLGFDRGLFADPLERPDKLKRRANPGIASPQEAVPPASPALLKVHRHMVGRYWEARRLHEARSASRSRDRAASALPFPPVMTVTDQCIFLEAFRADETALVRLVLERDGFRDLAGWETGSAELVHSPVSDELRRWDPNQPLVLALEAEQDSALAPEFALAPGIPRSWVRSWSLLQEVLARPAQRVDVGREALYAILAFLRRNRTQRGPRALRFELDPAAGSAVVIEPWELRIPLPRQNLVRTERQSIRVWGRDRLRTFSELLPTIDGLDVWLWDSAMPSLWSARAGQARLELAVTGWSALDPASVGTPVDDLNQSARAASPFVARQVAAALVARSPTTRNALATELRASDAQVVECLAQLAGQGTILHDHVSGLYQSRQTPRLFRHPLEDDPEMSAGRSLAQTTAVVVMEDHVSPSGIREVNARILGLPVKMRLDPDGRIRGAICSCHAFRTYRMTCRHLHALRGWLARHPV